MYIHIYIYTCIYVYISICVFVYLSVRHPRVLSPHRGPQLRQADVA